MTFILSQIGVCVFITHLCVCKTSYACVCVFVRAPAYPPTRAWVDGSLCTRARAYVCFNMCAWACVGLHVRRCIEAKETE